MTASLNPDLGYPMPVTDPGLKSDGSVALRRSAIPDILRRMLTDDPKYPRSPSIRGRTSITVHVAPDQLAAIDEWIEEDGARFDRSEAVRALVDHALGRTVASRGVRLLPPRLRSLDDIDPPA